MSTENTIALPVYDIIITLDDGGGTITHGLYEEHDTLYNSAIDGITSMILAHAIAGVDVESPEYIEGIETAVNACADNI